MELEAQQARSLAEEQYRKAYTERYLNAFVHDGDNVAYKELDKDAKAAGENAYKAVLSGKKIAGVSDVGKAKPAGKIERGIDSKKLTRANAAEYLNQLSDRQRRVMQQKLVDAGYLDNDDGKVVDGVIGKKTLDAYMSGESDIQEAFETEEKDRRDTIKTLKGLKKKDVIALQKRMIEDGYLDSSKRGEMADGIMGANTIKAFLKMKKDIDSNDVVVVKNDNVGGGFKYTGNVITTDGSNGVVDYSSLNKYTIDLNN